MSQRVQFLRNQFLAKTRQQDPGERLRKDLLHHVARFELENKTRKAVENIIHYHDCGSGELAILCDRYGCDKGSVLGPGRYQPYWPQPPHTYAEIYDALLASERKAVRAVFECGVGCAKTSLHGSSVKFYPSGASLRVWRDYFPNAVIWGGDIDKSALFQEGRIRTAWLDQTDPESARAFFEQTGISQFDVMFDDGLHTYTAAWTLFQSALPYLKEGGIYIIEDLSPQFICNLQERLQNRSDLIVKYFIMETTEVWANSLVIIRKLRN